MRQEIYTHTLANGLTLLAERMPHVRSAALNFLVPAGCVYDPVDQLGMASLLSEMIRRGAGERDSRQLSLALDNLGLDHSESVSQVHMRLLGATLASNLAPALAVYADILRRPHLPKAELPAAKALALQNLEALADSPQGMTMVELRRRYWPLPLGRDRRGTPDGLRRVTADSLRKHFERVCGPRGTILSIAGNIDWKPLRDQVEALFGDWQGNAEPTLKLKKPVGGRGHIKKEDTVQTQIAVAYPSLPFGHPNYFAAQGAVQVLSGGMGARLFTEVREKRGLCYSVYASYQTFKDRGCIYCYAGTTNERAQETLDVTLQEVRRLADGVTEEEVQRVQAGLKSSVIMQEESTSARAGLLASDWYFLGRIRPIEEIQALIEGLTPAAIVSYAKEHPPRGDMTVVTLGPKPLKVPNLD